MSLTKKTAVGLIEGLSLVWVITLGATGYLAYTAYQQADRIETLLQERNFFQNQSNERQNKLLIASSTIINLQEELNEIHEDLEELADDYKDEKNRNEEFEDQIRDLAGTLGDLEKLESIDDELLAKYSKVYFLNENYIPERLKKVDDEWLAPGKDDAYFHYRAYKHLEDLMDAAEKDGVQLTIVSAYRSFDEQTELKGQYQQVYGTGANAFSADQGYSEHQLGTTVDFSSAANSNQLNQSFDQTEEFAWLQENAHKYGFILSYPQGNAYYIYEPWHWRFVSTELAGDLKRKNQNFYDMEQREINSYLLEFFD